MDWPQALLYAAAFGAIGGTVIGLLIALVKVLWRLRREK